MPWMTVKWRREGLWGKELWGFIFNSIMDEDGLCEWLKIMHGPCTFIPVQSKSYTLNFSRSKFFFYESAALGSAYLRASFGV